MKTNRDKVAIIYAIIWLLSNIVAFLILGNLGVLISTYGFILIMSVVVVVDRKSITFRNWLNKGKQG